MSQFNTSPFKTFIAGADLSAAQYCFVKLSSGKVVVATAGTDKILGVLYSTGTTDQPVTVQLYGTAKVKASTSITALAYLTATTGGKAVTTTTAGHVVRGTALQAATAEDDIIEVQLQDFHHKA